MSNTVLKTVTKQMIAECRAVAEQQYMARHEHHGVDFAGEFDEFGNLPPKFFRGPMIEFTAVSVEGLIDLVIEKQSQGWKRSSVLITNEVSNYYVIQMIKPDEAIQADLKEEFKEAEAALHAQVSAYNEQIISATVAQRKSQMLKEREEEAKAADAALEAELHAEVRAALKSAK